MGGRGASAKSWDEYQDMLDQLYPRYKPKTKYNYTESSELPPGAHHAFFATKNRAFTIITYSTEENHDELNILPQHSFGGEPAIRWVSDGQVNEVYLDSMTTEEFMEVTGVRFDLHKGGYVLSKRMSRAFREYYVQTFFPDDEVRIHYLPEDEIRDKIWDGAGLISRKMLLKMKLEPLERAIKREKDDAKRKKLSAKHAKLSRELRTAKRIEFTVQSEKGQDKGHAIVTEELFDDDGNEMDFILIEDTKKEVALVNGQKWVGINFVHGHDHMRLDIQSLIHLQEFLDIDNLEQYVQEEGKLFVESLQNGTAGRAMKRIDKNETVEDIQNWAVREFVACGGDVRWSPQLIKTIANQHLKRLNESTIEKLRIPIPGGRHYCLPAAVGQRAGLDIQVGRGEIKIDSEHDTAWVNDEDWLELEDSPKDPKTGQGQGLAAIWGGADNDDALWLFGFTDEKDGERKILAWRSPNQLGEYAVLKPTADSPDPSTSSGHRLTLETIDGEISYPAADSRDLPLRTDHRPKIESIVDPNSAGGVGEGEAYSVEVMEKAIERAQMNAGVVGLYCNSLMLHKALFGTLPEDAPAPLEDVIDGAVKTGAELGAIKEWCINHSKQILEMGVPIPKIIQNRLAFDRNRPPDELVPPAINTPKNSDHWLDRLIGSIREHVKVIEHEREELIAQAAPPARLMDAVFFEDQKIVGLNTLEIGAQFNQRYGAINRIIQREKEWNDTDDQKLDQEIRDEILGLTQEERTWRLRQLIYEDKFKQIAERTNGILTKEHNDEAIRLADQTLMQLRRQNQIETKLHQKLHKKKWWFKNQEKQKWTDADHNRVRRYMQKFISQFPHNVQRAIMRGAMVSAYMNDSRTSDAAVWVPGNESPDGRESGIAEITIQALREICLIDGIKQSEDGVITYPSPKREPIYQTSGIRDAWFSWYQARAEQQGQPVPERPQDLDKETRKKARKEFKRHAKTYSGQEIKIIREDKRLIAYTHDGQRLGAITNDQLEEGPVLIKGAFARSGDLRIAIFDPKTIREEEETITKGETNVRQTK